MYKITHLKSLNAKIKAEVHINTKRITDNTWYNIIILYAQVAHYKYLCTYLEQNQSRQQSTIYIYIIKFAFY